MLYQVILDEWSLVLWQLSWHAVTLKQAFRLLKLSSPFSQKSFLYFLHSSFVEHLILWEPSRSPEDSEHVQYSVDYGERRWRLEGRDDALFHWINILHWNGPAARYRYSIIKLTARSVHSNNVKSYFLTLLLQTWLFPPWTTKGNVWYWQPQSPFTFIVSFLPYSENEWWLGCHSAYLLLCYVNECRLAYLTFTVSLSDIALYLLRQMELASLNFCILF